MEQLTGPQREHHGQAIVVDSDLRDLSPSDLQIASVFVHPEAFISQLEEVRRGTCPRSQRTCATHQPQDGEHEPKQPYELRHALGQPHQPSRAGQDQNPQGGSNEHNLPFAARIYLEPQGPSVKRWL
jgi:hypothetical protein